MKLIIKPGKHYSNRLLPQLKCSRISGEVLFESDMEYHVGKQKDTNKLIGLSDNFLHHQDSIRIGWRWNDAHNCLEIMTIRYANKIRTIDHLCYVDDLSGYKKFSIQITKERYIVNFDGVIAIINRSSKWWFLRYVLFPYFGGTDKSPRSFTFTFK